MKARTIAILAAAAALLAGACEQKKSANPLSPSVAGPIPGVEITAPKPLTPTAGSEIETAAQPVTLTLENASSSGQRPLTYLVEVAMDAEFSNKVVSREGLAPGENGQTSFKLPEPLAAERTYYWRARAQDGANTGPYSSGLYFKVFTPIVLQPPQLASPVNDTRVSERNPVLVLSNAGRSGPVGGIVYEFQVSTMESFAQLTASLEQGEQPGSTRVAVGQDLAYDTRFFWRARAWETTKNQAGPWSGAAAFRTPVAPPPPPTPPPPPSGGGSVGHIPPGPLTRDGGWAVIKNTFDEFPRLHAVFSSTTEAELAAEQLLLHTIWHLQLYGFQAGRQRNPSGAISKDKLTLFIDGAWHSYDVYSLGVAGRATTVQMLEVWPPNHVPDPGIPD